MSTPAQPVVEAAQRVLATEHEALYAYGVAGGVVDPASAEAARARDSYDIHRTRRDRLEDTVRRLGAEPVAAAPGYSLPAPVAGAASSARLAVRVEDRCGASYAELVASSAGPLRRVAIGWLSDAATRGLAWGARPTAFPGLAPRR